MCAVHIDVALCFVFSQYDQLLSSYPTVQLWHHFTCFIVMFVYHQYVFCLIAVTLSLLVTVIRCS